MVLPEKTLWVTWHEHRRTRSLVQWLAIPVEVYDDHRSLQRNTVGPLWTLGVLLKKRPDVIFTHFSFLLLAMIMVYKYLFRFGRVRVISDCHNKALKREISGSLAGVFKSFKKRMFQGVDLIIVTNTTLVPFAQTLCPRVSVLRDPLTDWLGEDSTVRDKGQAGGHVFFICSFDKDEPVDLIFESAQAVTRQLDRAVIISGKIPEDKVPARVRANDRIILPGFMPLQQYKETLFTAAAVVVLTEDDDCLVCGAYESLGASRPTVLSSTVSLKACFGDSATYTPHQVQDVVEAVKVAMQKTQDPRQARAVFESAYKEEWEEFLADLNAVPGLGAS